MAQELVYTDGPHINMYEITHRDRVWYKLVLGFGEDRVIVDHISSEGVAFEIIDKFLEGEYIPGYSLEGTKLHRGKRRVEQDYPGVLMWWPTITSVKGREMDSYSESADNRIFISGRTPEKRTVTMAHEAAHKYLGHTGYGSILSDNDRWDREVDAWRVAKKHLQESGSWDEDAEALAAEALGTYRGGTYGKGGKWEPTRQALKTIRDL